MLNTSFYPYSSSVNLADGSPSRITGYITVPVNLFSGTWVGKLYLIENLSYDAVLGINFLRESQAKCDFSNGIMTIRSNCQVKEVPILQLAAIPKVPKIEVTINKIRDCQFVTTLDLESGFLQMPLAESSRHLTGFNVHSGHFEFLSMPYGLRTGSSSFQRLMTKILHPVIGKFCLVYIDDVLVFSRTFEEHIDHLKQVFELLFQSGLMISRKNEKFVWGPEQEEAFNTIKQSLVNAPQLYTPDYDVGTFIIHADASHVGSGSILTQEIMTENGVEERVVAYYSKTFSKAEVNYSVVEKEALAIIHSVEAFRPYIVGSKIKVYSDCSSLQWLMNIPNPSGRLARWITRLSQYDLEIKYKKGKENNAADALSRIPYNLSALTAQDLLPKLPSICYALRHIRGYRSSSK